MKLNKYNLLRKKYNILFTDFTAWLQKCQFAKDTIRIECNYTGLYLEWLEQEQIQENEASYNDLLNYIDHCTSNGDGKAFINRKLSALRKYYDYLLYKGKAVKNPATGLFIKNKQHKIPSNLLTTEEFTAIYENYQVTDLRGQRNKVIIGLLIYQALTREELGKLEVTDIKLTAGKIEIKGSKHSNGRTLKLEALQMLDLQEYLTTTRPTILSKECFYGTGRRPTRINREKVKRQLFASMYGSDNVKGSFMHLIRGLRLTNPKLTNAQQIRQSVITNWLKTKDLRTVQYMAGHKHVSSTERYQVNQLDDLQEALNQFHPLK